jgi:hypothetical protein
MKFFYCIVAAMGLQSYVSASKPVLSSEAKYLVMPTIATNTTIWNTTISLPQSVLKQDFTSLDLLNLAKINQQIASQQDKNVIWKTCSQLHHSDFMSIYAYLDKILEDTLHWKALEDRLLSVFKNKELVSRLNKTIADELVKTVAEIHSRRDVSTKCTAIAHNLKQRKAVSVENKNFVLNVIERAAKNTRLKAQINYDIGGYLYTAGALIAQEELECYQTFQQQYTEAQIIDLAVRIEKLESIIPEFNVVLKSTTKYKAINDNLLQRANQIIQNRLQLSFANLKHIQERFQVSLDKLLHQTAHANQNAIHRELAHTLHSFLQVPYREATELLMTSTVRDLSKVALHLHNNQKHENARQIVDMLKIMSEICRGSYNRLLPDGLLSEMLNVATGLAAHGGVNLSLNLLVPELVIPYNLGIFMYGLTQTKTDVIKNVKKIYSAIEKQDPYQLGESLTGLTIDALNTHKIHRAIKNTFLMVGKHAKMEDVFKAFKHGFTQREQHVESTKQALTVVDQIKKHEAFNALAEQAAKLGSSAQAIQRRIVDLCRKYELKDVLFKLKEINDALTVKCDVIPKGLLKKLKFNIDHLLRLEFDEKGNITGWHFDKLNFLFKYAKIEILEKDVLENGMYYVKYKYNGIVKQSTYFCNKRNDSVTLMKEVMDALSKVDYTKYQLSKDGRNYKVKIEFQGAQLIAQVNHKTSEVTTFYPYHASWDKYFYGGLNE